MGYVQKMTETSQSEVNFTLYVSNLFLKSNSMQKDEPLNAAVTRSFVEEIIDNKKVIIPKEIVLESDDLNSHRSLRDYIVDLVIGIRGWNRTGDGVKQEEVKQTLDKLSDYGRIEYCRTLLKLQIGWCRHRAYVASCILNRIFEINKLKYRCLCAHNNAHVWIEIEGNKSKWISIDLGPLPRAHEEARQSISSPTPLSSSLEPSATQFSDEALVPGCRDLTWSTLSTEERRNHKNLGYLLELNKQGPLQWEGGKEWRILNDDDAYGCVLLGDVWLTHEKKGSACVKIAKLYEENITSAGSDTAGSD